MEELLLGAAVQGVVAGVAVWCCAEVLRGQVDVPDRLGHIGHSGDAVSIRKDAVGLFRDQGFLFAEADFVRFVADGARDVLPELGRVRN